MRAEGNTLYGKLKSPPSSSLREIPAPFIAALETGQFVIKVRQPNGSRRRL
jgi:hypothetical protein